MKKQTDNKLCEVCETESADVICKECNSIHIFCKCCFDLSHRNKKGHIPKPIKSEVKNVSKDLSLQMYKCPIHPLEGLKYVCTECKIVACADCFAIGNHIKHIPKSFEQSIHLILSTFAKELEDTKRTLMRAKSMNESIGVEREKDIEAFNAFSSSLKEQFKLLHTIIDKKLHALLGAIQEERKKVMNYYENSIKSSNEICSRLINRIAYLDSTMKVIQKEANPSNYTRYRDLAPDGLHEATESAINDLLEYLMLREKFRVPPQVLMEDVTAAINSLDFAPNKNIKIDSSFNKEKKELEIIIYDSKINYNGIKAKAVDL